MRFTVILLLALFCSTPAMSGTDPFPRPSEIQPAVEFWTKVYSQVGTDGGLLHDRDNLSVIYETLSFTENLWHPSRERKINRRRTHYKEVLRTLAGGKREGLSNEEQRVLSLFPDDVTNDQLQRAVNNIRFQLGQADRFREGLIRSGAWMPFMLETLDDMELPRELAALPHVESSFNPNAWSRVGAAGIWQFTRPTGKRYMRVDHVVDQRMDPFAATEAAGRMLRHNHSVTEDWAQAITAYNHGLAGIRRAVREAGSENIADLIRDYRGRNWGFASRNFYPAFLAAVYVDRNADQYFGELDRHAPLKSETVELPFYTPISAVLEATDASRETLRELNRGLRDPVWNGQKRLPRGYRLRLPAGEEHPAPREVLARIDEGRRYFAQIPDREHTVQRGDALSTIAARYNTTTQELVALNNLRNRHQIRAGQTLRLPVEGEAEPIASERYTVRRGDTLSEIAHRAGMSTSALAAANGIDPERPIRAGMTLRVDGRTGEDVAAAVPEEPAPSPAAEEPATAEAKPAEPEPSDVPEEPLVVAANHFNGDPANQIAQQVMRVAGVGRRASAVRPPESREPEPRIAGDIAAEMTQSEADELASDPADYDVADDNTIEVQAAETLGHYADWLDVRASDLRRINNMNFHTPLVLNQRVKLDLSQVTAEQFEERRRRYHRELQAAFFERYNIEDTRTYRVERGDSLWTLTEPATDVPVWLLRQYNPDLDFTLLHPGDEIEMPVIREIEK